MSATPVTLLQRLRHGSDPEAWPRFVELYTPLLYAWARQVGLADEGAADLVQDVFAQLLDKLPTFIYDPQRSFRAWLKTLTHRAWCEFLDRRRRTQTGSGDSQVLSRLEQVEARDELEKRLAEEYDRELLDAAIFEVRRRVAPKTWEAFRLLAFEGTSGAEVAEKLGMKIGAVYVSRSNVQKMLKEQLKLLEES